MKEKTFSEKVDEILQELHPEGYSGNPATDLTDEAREAICQLVLDMLPEVFVNTRPPFLSEEEQGYNQAIIHITNKVKE